MQESSLHNDDEYRHMHTQMHEMCNQFFFVSITYTHIYVCVRVYTYRITYTSMYARKSVYILRIHAVKDR